MFEEIIREIRATFKSDGFIALHEPVFDGNEKTYLNECIDSTFVSSVGKYVDRFESECAVSCGVKYGVATSNGTVALQIALLASGVKPSDEVITQSFTFVATANAISHVGAKAIFIDIASDNLSLSPSKLEQFLEENTSFDSDGNCINRKSGKIIRACVPMHTFGFMAKMNELINICKKYNLILIEDAAEALGSKLNGHHAGSFGQAGVLSFNGNKIITTGGGGVIVTNDEALAKKMKHLTTTAKVPHKWEFSHDEIGFNFRLPNLNAALGVAQIENLKVKLERKKKLFDHYSKVFEKYESVNLWKPRSTEEPNFWLNALIFPSSIEKEKFLSKASESNVMARPAWKPMHLLEIYKHCQRGDMKNTEYYYDRIVNIPSSPVEV